MSFPIPLRARIYVLYGQGGFMTSVGMWRLSRRIAAAWPTSYVTTHSWKYPGAIVNDRRALPQGTYKKIIVIGYSLGANSVTNIGQYMLIDLAVAYDPSQLGQVIQPSGNIKHMLLYHNTGTVGPGHLIFTGPQVERVDVNTSHLAVCYNEELHQKTLAAIGELLTN